MKQKKNKGLVFAFAMIILVSLLLYGCVERIAVEEFETKDVVLSKNVIELDRQQHEDFYLGIVNKDEEKKDFSLVINCMTGNCDENLVLQAFPTIGIEGGKKGAFPLRIQALAEARKGEYQYELSVMKDDITYGTEILSVVVTGAVEEMKKEIIEKSA
ncbi:hypothetical protein KY336_00235 [Candidatus Woesearchaeota archaeon]|nr:hypothetical protein [Candidatus Woesearchaeota archaeon]